MSDNNNGAGKDEPENDSDYEIGRGKPPKHTRFKPGQSGNPKGRPKGSRNFSTDVKNALKAQVKITIDGRSMTMSRQQASIEMLVQKAFSGNDKLLLELQRLAASYGDDEVETTVEKSLPAKDADIIDQFLKSQMGEGSMSGGDDDAGT